MLWLPSTAAGCLTSSTGVLQRIAVEVTLKFGGLNRTGAGWPLGGTGGCEGEAEGGGAVGTGEGGGGDTVGRSGRGESGEGGR